MGAGTMAYFTDAESSTDNTVQTGTLDLKLGGDDTTVTFLDARGISPGDSGSDSVAIENHGSLDGTIEIDLTAVQSTDKNGGEGDLDDYLLVRAEVGSEEVISEDTVDSLSTGAITVSDDTVGANSSKAFALYWDLPSSTPNKVQGDSVRLDFTFRLVQ